MRGTRELATAAAIHDLGLGDCGFTYVAAGSYRSVYTHPSDSGNVYKVERHAAHDGMCGNKREAQIAYFLRDGIVIDGWTFRAPETTTYKVWPVGREPETDYYGRLRPRSVLVNVAERAPAHATNWDAESEVGQILDRFFRRAGFYDFQIGCNTFIVGKTVTLVDLGNVERDSIPRLFERLS